MGRFLQIFHKKRPLVHYGLSENSQQYCLVKYHQGNTETSWYAKKADSLSEIQQIIGLNQKNYRLIRSLTHHVIWRKPLLLPIKSQEIEIYRHVIQQLKQHLPLPLSDIYFDYRTIALPNREALLVIIYATTKACSEEWAITPDTYLDCEWNCLQRAYHFLAQRECKNILKTGYAINDKVLIFNQNEIGLKNINEKGLDGDLILEELYTFEESNVLPNTEKVKISLTKEIESEVLLYLTALGAALWH